MSMTMNSIPIEEFAWEYGVLIEENPEPFLCSDLYEAIAMSVDFDAEIKQRKVFIGEWEDYAGV